MPGVGANLAGKDGDDAHRYQETQVRKALRRLREAEDALKAQQKQQQKGATAVNAEHEQRRYSMVIQWSDDDQTYLVLLPEWRTVSSVAELSRTATAMVRPLRMVRPHSRR